MGLVWRSWNSRGIRAVLCHSNGVLRSRGLHWNGIPPKPVVELPVMSRRHRSLLRRMQLEMHP